MTLLSHKRNLNLVFKANTGFCKIECYLFMFKTDTLLEKASFSFSVLVRYHFQMTFLFV